SASVSWRGISPAWRAGRRRAIAATRIPAPDSTGAKPSCRGGRALCYSSPMEQKKRAVRVLGRRALMRSGGAGVLSLALLRHLPAASQDWRAEWDATVARAKSEGAVTVCASSNRSRRDFIIAEWQKDYPEIALSYQVV